MSSKAAYNKNNSGVKRIMAEARELQLDTSTEYTACPLEDDIFDWHCTLRGPAGTEFEGGLYHARILLPPEYPFKAPSVMLLTPNGRFELNKKICISFTAYHEDQWQPSWGVRTAIIGLQSFFPLKGEGALGVGGIEAPIPERKRLAALSRDWVCSHCKQSNAEALPHPPTNGSSVSAPTGRHAVPGEASGKVHREILDSETPGEEPLSVKPDAQTTHSESPPPPKVKVEETAVTLQEPLVVPVAITQSQPLPAPVSTVSPSAHVATPTPSAISRRLELTPSTPANRILPPRRERSPIRDTTVPLSRTNDPHDRGMDTRDVPLTLDLAIMALVVILIGIIVRRMI